MTNKFRGLLCFVFFLCVLIGCSDESSGIDSHGNVVRLNRYHGKWVFVNYWAPWSKPSLEVLLSLNKFYRQHKKQVMVIAVSFDHLSNQEMNRFAKRYELSFPVMARFTTDRFNTKYVSVVPVTFVISPKGQLVRMFRGGSQTMDDFKSVL